MKRLFNKILAGNKYVLLSNISERLFFFVVFLIIARNYPAGQFGELVTVFSLANIFILLFDFGLPILLQREVSIIKENASVYFSNVLIINFIAFPFFIISVYAYCYIFFSDIDPGMVLIVSLIVYLFSTVNLINRALSGLSLFRSQFVAIISSRSLVIILIVLALLIPGLALFDILLILISGAILQLLILFNYSSANKLNLTFKGFNLAEVRSLLKVSIPLGLAVVFNFLYDKIDIILISKLTIYDQTAYYNIGYGVFKASAIAYSFMFITGFTRVSFLSKNKKAVSLFFKKYFAILFWICLVLTIFFLLCADIIIDTIYTENYSDASGILKILSFATFGLAFNNLTGIILNGLGLFKQNMIITLIGLIINVILNIIFIPVYGIIACAVITVITEYFIFAGDYFFIRKYIKY